MSSPLAFSGIAVSPSARLSISSISSSSRSGGRSGVSAKRRYDSDQHDHHHVRADVAAALAMPPPSDGSNPLPVLVHVRKERVLLTTLLFGGTTCALMLVFTRGVVVARFESDASDTIDEFARRQRAVDDLNFYLGAVTSLFVRPLLAVVALVVPVALLCFATRAYMQNQRSWQVQIAMFLVANAVVWLLSNGFHGANVHLTAPRVRSVLRSVDLSGANPDDAGADTANDTSAVQSIDTILRSAIQPQQASQQDSSATQCSRESPRRLPALVEFGFASRDWFSSALPTPPAAVASLSRKVSELSETTAPLPLARTSAQRLFSSTLLLMNDFFRDPTTIEGVSAAAFEPEPTSILESDAALYSAMHAKLRAVFNASSASFPHFASFDAVNAEFHFDSFELSPQVVFESLTLDIPLDASELRRRVVLEPNGDTTQEMRYGNSDRVFEVNPKEECSPLGCVVSAKGERMSAARVDYGSQVRALAICVDSATGAEDWSTTLDAASACATQSNHSVLVFSFAKRITGDELEVLLNSTASIVKLSNPIKHYTVTVGRLSWAVADLAETFHASCDADEGCEGLMFPLQAEARDLRRQHLVVGKQQLPVALQYAAPAASTPQRWGTILVGSNVQEIDDGGALKSDLVFPRNFQRVVAWDGAITGSRCEVERGAFLDRIVRSHLYSEDSLQPAYTAAFFWLFQRAAVVRETRPLPAGEAAGMLAFSGNLHVSEAQLSIPRFSAVLTGAGCAVLLLLGVAVQLGGKRREAHIERYFSAHHLARLVLDDATLPRQMVTCNLLNVANDRLGSSEHLDDFDISGLALRHCQDPGNVLHVPPPLSTSLSSSFLSAAANASER